MFYGDTLLKGSAPAVRCGRDFFEPDYVLFASDGPFAPESRPMLIRDGSRSVEARNLQEAVRRKICSANARRLLARRRVECRVRSIPIDASNPEYYE